MCKVDCIQKRKSGSENRLLRKVEETGEDLEKLQAWKARD